jgi:hypothetical protein
MANKIQMGTGDPVFYENDERMDIAVARAERNNLLAESDKYIVTDYPTAKKAAWKTYRQALRDFSFPGADDDLIVDPVWPTKPE